MCLSWPSKADKRTRNIVRNIFQHQKNYDERYKIAKELQKKLESIIAERLFQEIEGKNTSYFQRVAINRAVEAVLKLKSYSSRNGYRYR